VPVATIQQQFIAARDLLTAKRYAEARALLIQIDHPTAKQWLARLDQIAPVPTPAAPPSPAPAPVPDAAHDETVREAQHLLLRGDYDRDTPANPEAWQCPVCGRRLGEASRCPQRGEPPCPMQVEERPVEEARRLALILDALHHDPTQNIEKLLGTTDSARLERWSTALKWQLAHLLEPDIRRPAIEAAVTLLGQLIEQRRA
jgi:hypothetical protein